MTQNDLQNPTNILSNKLVNHNTPLSKHNWFLISFWTNETSSTSQLFIEVLVSSQEVSCHVHVC
jgi:hypothetical protein